MKSKLISLVLSLSILVLPLLVSAEVQSSDVFDEFEVIMIDQSDNTEVSFPGYQRDDRYFLPLEDILSQLNYYVEYDEELNTVYATSLNSNSPEHIFEINLDDQTLIYYEKQGDEWVGNEPRKIYYTSGFGNRTDGLVLIDDIVYIDRVLITSLFDDINSLTDNWQAFNRGETNLQINITYKSEK